MSKSSEKEMCEASREDVPPGNVGAADSMGSLQDAASEAALRFDWEELAGIIGRGDVETITGHIGRCLQIRPKARDSHARRRGVDVDGARFAALPRGFYLRATFTSEILRQNYAL